MRAYQGGHITSEIKLVNVAAYLSPNAGNNASSDAVLQGKGAPQGKDPFPHAHVAAAPNLYCG